MQIDPITDTIFVTGGAGLVGRELLTQLLDKNYRVRALYHRTSIDIEHPNLEVIQGDILDVVLLEEALEGITQVVHCAALISYDPADQYRLLKMNVEGTANVVNACIDGNIGKLVYVSSVAAIGRPATGLPVQESVQWTEESNHSNYGRSKYLAEMEVWRGIGEGLNAVIVNPSVILGGDDWSSGSSAIFKSIFDGFPWYSDGVAGFVDVQDVARAIIGLMERDISGERFILNGVNESFKNLFEMIAGCFGKKAPHKKVTPFLAELVWRLEAVKARLTGKKPLVSKETARISLAHVHYDHSKILNALPEFQFTPLQETVSRTCAAMLKKYNV